MLERRFIGLLCFFEDVLSFLCMGGMSPSFSFSGNLCCLIFSFRTLCNIGVRMFELLLIIFAGMLPMGDALLLLNIPN